MRLCKTIPRRLISRDGQLEASPHALVNLVGQAAVVGTERQLEQ